MVKLCAKSFLFSMERSISSVFKVIFSCRISMASSDKLNAELVFLKKPLRRTCDEEQLEFFVGLEIFNDGPDIHCSVLLVCRTLRGVSVGVKSCL